MHMLYDSDNYAVMQFDAIAAGGTPGDGPIARGGYEIVDKFARKEIFIDGALAECFKHDVEALIRGEPTEEEIDAFLGRYTPLMQQPVVMH